MTTVSIIDKIPQIPKNLKKDIIPYLTVGRLATEKYQTGNPNLTAQKINNGVRDIVSNDKVFMQVDLIDEAGQTSPYTLHYQWNDYKDTESFYDNEFGIKHLISQLRPAQFDESADKDQARIKFSSEPFQGINQIERDLIDRAHCDRLISYFSDPDKQSVLVHILDSAPSAKKDHKKWLDKAVEEVTDTLPRHAYNALADDNTAILPANSEIQLEDITNKRDISVRKNGQNHPGTIDLEKKLWYWPEVNKVIEDSTRAVLTSCLNNKNNTNVPAVLSAAENRRTKCTDRLSVNVSNASAAANHVYSQLRMIDRAVTGCRDSGGSDRRHDMWWINAFMFSQNDETDTGDLPVEMAITDADTDKLFDDAVPDKAEITTAPFHQIRDLDHHIESVLVLDKINGGKQLEKLYHLAESRRWIIFVQAANEVLDGQRECTNVHELRDDICETYVRSDHPGAAGVALFAAGATDRGAYGEYMQPSVISPAADAMALLSRAGHAYVPKGHGYFIEGYKNLSSSALRDRTDVINALPVNTLEQISGRYHLNAFNSMSDHPTQRSIIYQAFRNRIAVALKRELYENKRYSHITEKTVPRILSGLNNTVSHIVHEMKSSDVSFVDETTVEILETVEHDNGQKHIKFIVNVNTVPEYGGCSFSIAMQ